MGYGFTDRPEEAELILLNTCAVRENAEKRVLGNIGAMKHYKEHRPNLIIAVVGCMTQQQPYRRPAEKKLSPCGPGAGYQRLHPAAGAAVRAADQKPAVLQGPGGFGEQPHH